VLQRRQPWSAAQHGAASGRIQQGAWAIEAGAMDALMAPLTILVATAMAMGSTMTLTSTITRLDVREVIITNGVGGGVACLGANDTKMT